MFKIAIGSGSIGLVCGVLLHGWKAVVVALALTLLWVITIITIEELQ